MARTLTYPEKIELFTAFTGVPLYIVDQLKTTNITNVAFDTCHDVLATIQAYASIDDLDNFIALTSLYQSFDFQFDDNLLLKTAMQHRCDKIVKYLLNEQNVDIYNEIVVIAASGNVDILKLVLEKGGNVSYNKNEPIRLAVRVNNLENVKLLVESGADFRVDNDAPFRIAVEEEALEIIKYFIELGVDVHLTDSCILEELIITQAHDCVQFLLEEGANIKYITDKMLIKIIKNNDVKLMRLLITHGLDFAILNNQISNSSKHKAMIELLDEQKIDFKILSYHLLKKK